MAKDVKDPLNIEGRKQYALIVIDDNSRLHCNIYDRIKTEDVTHSLKETIEKWCKKEGIEVEYTPPYYPQAKGKIERAIRTFNEEFLKMFFYYFRNLLNGLTIIDTTWVSMIILPMYIFQKMLPMLLDNTFSKDLYKANQGIVEGIFGGLETKRLLFSRFKKEDMRRKHVIGMAICHNLQTYMTIFYPYNFLYEYVKWN